MMDTSKEYIKMCEKAVEIQKDWRWENFKKGDWMAYKSGDVRVVDCSYQQFRELQHAPFGEFPTWLPRQDQLQILSGLSWQEFDKECLKYNMPTKEQAGLKVVLKLLDKTTQ